MNSIRKIGDSVYLNQPQEQLAQLSQLIFFFSKSPKQQHSPEKLTQLALHVFETFNINVDQYGYMDLTRTKQGVQFQLGHSLVLVWFYNGRLYLGEARNKAQGLKQMDGQGLLITPNVSCYRGSFSKNKKHGRGIYVSSSGEKYQGQWKNDVYEGLGTLVNESSQYEGSFENGLKHGFGVEIFDNGDSYQGEYFQQKFDGRGKYNWKNKTQYLGQFSNGFMQGQGIWMSARDTYEGSYHRNMKHGYGIYRWGNGKVYEGRFEKGRRVSKHASKKPTIDVEKQLPYDFEEDCENESEIYDLKLMHTRGSSKRRYTIQTSQETQIKRSSKFSFIKI